MHVLQPLGKFSYGHAKLLTLLVLLIVVYWGDLEELSSLISANNWTCSALTALGLICVYLLLKSRLVNKIINIRGRSMKTGLLFLASSFILYLVGSYYAAKPVIHMVSLVFFTSSYLMIRMNILAVRILSPVLLTVFTLSLLTASDPLASFIPALLFSVFAGSPILFSKLGIHVKLLVAAINVLLYFLLKAVPLTDQTLLLLACSELLAFWLFERGRSSTSDFEEQMDKGSCSMCSHSENTSDFCPFCGRILVQRVAKSRLEVLEATLFIVFILSQLVSIPVLVGDENEAAISYLRVQGAVRQAVSFSSSDWLLYDKHSLNGYMQESSESLVFKEMLVPKSFPETKNYTVVLELAPLDPRIAKSWRFMPWKVQTTRSVLLSDSIPAVYYEVSSKGMLLKVIVWTGKISLFIGENLVTRTVGVSVFRNYTTTPGGQNATYTYQSTAEFLEDAEQISFNTIRMLELASRWSQIFFTTRTLLLSVSSVLLIALIIVSVAGVSIFAVSKAHVAEAYLLELLPKEQLEMLLTVDRLAGNGVPTTGENLLREMKTRPLGISLNTGRLLKNLDDLEALKLVKRRIRVGVKTVFMEWRLDF